MEPPRLEAHEISHTALNIKAQDICRGADPFIFRHQGLWHLLIQENFNEDPHAHDGIKGYTVRTATKIENLLESEAVPIEVSYQPDNLRQVWAAEIHFDRYLYVAISDGNNVTHRIHVYETAGAVCGPWKYIGPLIMPPEDSRWAIDLTLAPIYFGGEEKMYAVWSGWDEVRFALTEELVVPQSIYIAEFVSPFEIGPRHLLRSPEDEWCCSVASILEGPQTLKIDGTFKGLLVTGNASWTEKYATSILKYTGGDPKNASSWYLHPDLLFKGGHGIGHGMIVQDEGELYYVGHRKTALIPGWRDRMVFYTQLPHQGFSEYLDSSDAVTRAAPPVLPTALDTA